MPGTGFEGGVDSSGLPCHGEAFVCQRVGQQPVREVLVVAELGLGVDAVRHVDQKFGPPVHFRGQSLLGDFERVANLGHGVTLGGTSPYVVLTSVRGARYPQARLRDHPS
jgi:hypothetical protein